MKFLLLTFVITIILSNVESDNFVIGNVANRVRLVKHETVEYNAFPFMKRVKQYFYSMPDQNKVISGIQALDTLHSKASINITAGGIGHPFVNMRLKSERGRGLSYDIGFYVNEEY